MDLAAAVNNKIHLEEFKEVIKAMSLETGKFYKIYNVSIVPTKWGKGVACELETNTLWLPKRYLSLFKADDQFRIQLNTGEYKLRIESFITILGNKTPINKFEKI